tara:strand:+ start:3517 stop:5358 length:1842 start_codon:yes stop_codon:yes gene_type:complete
MCGFLTLISQEPYDNKNKITKSLSLLQARGPDERNIYHSNCKRLWMGHTRLQINDLSIKSSQPMSRSNLTLSFNGEVYNYKKLISKFKLQDRLSTTGDTEVLIRLIEKIGIVQSLREIEGMFALSIFDSIKQKVYFATDKRGEKPLYISSNNSNIIIASSRLNVIRNYIEEKKIDYDALESYLAFGYIRAPLTILEGIKKVPPGKIIEISMNHWNINNYTYENRDSEVKRTSMLTRQSIKELLVESVREQLDCDANKGLFLSSGIDSSLIASIAKKELNCDIPSFTAQLKESNWDESSKAEKIANYLGLDLNKVVIGCDEVKNYFENFNQVFDEPFSDPSQVACYEITKYASKDIKVLLGGDGADELFYGYRRYQYANYIKFIKQFNLSEILIKLLIQSNYIKNMITRNDIHGDYRIQKLVKILRSDNKEPYKLLAASEPEPLKYLNRTFISQEEENENIYYMDTINADEIRNKDIDFYLPWNNLVKLDRTSMSNSIEARNPFLNSQVYNFAMNKDYSKHGKKRILKDILKEYLPKYLIGSKKIGFGMPVTDWINIYLMEESCKYLSKDRLDTIGLLNKDQVENTLAEARIGNHIASIQVWRLMILVKWFESI